MNLKHNTFLVIFASIAFLKFATGAALAYYNPQTGRWLSRDPAGEPGFQLVQWAGRPLRAYSPVPALPPGRWLVRELAPQCGRRQPLRFRGERRSRQDRLPWAEMLPYDDTGRAIPRWKIVVWSLHPELR